MTKHAHMQAGMHLCTCILGLALTQAYEKHAQKPTKAHIRT